MSDNEKMLEKVRKLLAKAEAEGVTPQEAEALNDKAAELIAQYGIDRARLAAEKPETDQIIRKTILINSAFSIDKTILLWAIAKPLRVESVRWREHGQRFDGRYGAVYRMELVGWKSDIERVDLLYTSLLLQSAHELARVRIPRGEDVAAYRRTWLAGFSNAVRSRLTEAETAAQERADAARPAAPGDSAGSSVALVLADRSLAVQQVMKQAFPDTRKSARRALRGSGYSSGKDAGMRANLHSNRTVGRGSAPALAGR